MTQFQLSRNIFEGGICCGCLFQKAEITVFFVHGKVVVGLIAFESIAFRPEHCGLFEVTLSFAHIACGQINIQGGDIGRKNICTKTVDYF